MALSVDAWAAVEGNAISEKGNTTGLGKFFCQDFPLVNFSKHILLFSLGLVTLSQGYAGGDDFATPRRLPSDRWE